MVKMIVVFLFMVASIHTMIVGWRYLTGKERWELVKTLAYSVGLGIITVSILSLIVILF